MKARKELNIGALPGRRNKALSVTEYHQGGGATVRPLAYFKDQAAYEEFKAILDGRPIFLGDSDAVAPTQPQEEEEA